MKNIEDSTTQEVVEEESVAFACRNCGAVRSQTTGVAPKVCAACGAGYFKPIPSPTPPVAQFQGVEHH